MDDDEFNLFLSLSEDPELALAEYESIIRKELLSKIDGVTNITQKTGLRREYELKLRAFSKANDLLFEFPKVDWKSSNEDGQFQNFFADVAYYITVIKARHARRTRSASTIIRLPQEIKQQIHHHLNMIREAIESTDIPIKKKEVIQKKWLIPLTPASASVGVRHGMVREGNWDA